MNRTKTITVRVSDGEHQAYKALAESKGKPLGELVRYLLEREILLAQPREP